MKDVDFRDASDDSVDSISVGLCAHSLLSQDEIDRDVMEIRTLTTTVSNDQHQLEKQRIERGYRQSEQNCKQSVDLPRVADSGKKWAFVVVFLLLTFIVPAATDQLEIGDKEINEAAKDLGITLPCINNTDTTKGTTEQTATDNQKKNERAVTAFAVGLAVIALPILISIEALRRRRMISRAISDIYPLGRKLNVLFEPEDCGEKEE